MEGPRCSFKSIIASDCSYDRRDKSENTSIVPLSSCQKDLASHKSVWKFHGVENEEELILCRAGIYYAQPNDVAALNVCPFHRSELGIGWRRVSNKCRVPQQLAHHRKGKAKTTKGERGIGKQLSKFIFQKIGVLVAVGSGNNQVKTVKYVTIGTVKMLPLVSIFHFLSILCGIGICKKCRTTFEPILAQGNDEPTVGDIRYDEIHETTSSYSEIETLGIGVQNISLVSKKNMRA